jgi:alpha-glucosidase
VRWVQNGVMHPRFTIHSWNDDQTVNEPWMYPGVTPAIRGAIELRYRLLPYLYTLLWQAHADDEPMLRPTFLDHEHDTQTLPSAMTSCWPRPAGGQRGRSRQRERRVWLPDNGPAGMIFTPTSGCGRPVDRPRRAAGKTAAAGRAGPVCRSANASRM